MIRGNTLLTLAVVLGLAYVFGQEANTEKRQEGEALLPDIEPDVADAPEVEKKDETVADPRWRYRYRNRKRYRYRYRYRRNKPSPSPTPKPTENPPPPTPDGEACSTSRPPTDGEWANDWQGHMFFECPRGKKELFALYYIGPTSNGFSCSCNSQIHETENGNTAGIPDVKRQHQKLNHQTLNQLEKTGGFLTECS